MQMAPHIARSLAGEDIFGKFEHMIKERDRKVCPKFFYDFFYSQLSLVALLIKTCGFVGNHILMNSLVGV